MKELLTECPACGSKDIKVTDDFPGESPPWFECKSCGSCGRCTDDHREFPVDEDSVRVNSLLDTMIGKPCMCGERTINSRWDGLEQIAKLKTKKGNILGGERGLEYAYVGDVEILEMRCTVCDKVCVLSRPVEDPL